MSIFGTILQNHMSGFPPNAFDDMKGILGAFTSRMTKLRTMSTHTALALKPKCERTLSDCVSSETQRDGCSSFESLSEF